MLGRHWIQESSWAALQHRGAKTQADDEMRAIRPRPGFRFPVMPIVLMLIEESRSAVPLPLGPGRSAGVTSH